MRVLIAEDDPISRTVLRKMLERWGPPGSFAGGHVKPIAPVACQEFYLARRKLLYASWAKRASLKLALVGVVLREHFGVTASTNSLTKQTHLSPQFPLSEP